MLASVSISHIEKKRDPVVPRSSFFSPDLHFFSFCSSTKKSILGPHMSSEACWFEAADSPKVLGNFQGTLAPSSSASSANRTNEQLYSPLRHSVSNNSPAVVLHNGGTMMHRGSSRQPTNNNSKPAPQRMHLLADRSSDEMTHTSLILHKMWKTCCAFVSRKSAPQSDGQPDDDVHGGRPLLLPPMQLPLQVLLLTIRWLRLSMSWEDALRLARRNGSENTSLTQRGMVSNQQIAAVDWHHQQLSHQSALLCLDRTAFLQTLEAAMVVHLSTCSPPSISSPRDELAAFLLDRWDRSHELSDLDWFLEVSFDQQSPSGFAPASMFTATVLDVLAVYRERWLLLYSTLERLAMCHLEGLVTAVGSLLSVDSPPAAGDRSAAPPLDDEIRVIHSVASKWIRSAFSFDKSASLRHTARHPLSSPDSMWEMFVLYAVAIAQRKERYQSSSQAPSSPARRGRVICWNAAQVRAATLELLGDTLGSLLLPQVAWRERLRLGSVILISTADERRSELRAELELSLRQLYIHAAGHGEQTGTSLLTAEKLVHLLMECNLVTKCSERDLIRALSTVLEMHTNGGASALHSVLSSSSSAPLTAGRSHAVRNASRAARPNSARACHDIIVEHDERTDVITFDTFVRILEHTSRVVGSHWAPPPENNNEEKCETSSVGDFLRRLANTNVGREASRTVASEIAAKYDPTRDAEYFDRCLRDKDDSDKTIPKRNNPHSFPLHPSSVFKRVVARFLQPSGVSATGPSSGRKGVGPGTTLVRDGGGIGATQMLELIVKSGVVPSMGSRADVSRILRSVQMDKTTSIWRDEDFLRFVCVLARLPKLQLRFDLAAQMILQCIVKYLSSLDNCVR